MSSSTSSSAPPSVKKYVMLVDGPAGPLQRLIPRLRELELRVIRVGSAADAEELVRAFPKLSLVAVNAHLDEAGSRALLATMRELQPHLPILWHGDAEGIGQSRSEAVFSREPRAEEVTGHVQSVLEARGYAPDVVAVLAEAAVAALSGFGAHCFARDPFLKASRTELAELNALISFSGTSAWGHLVVGASREVARRAYARTLSAKPAPAEGDLSDLLGEVCNRIMGPLLQHIGPEDPTATFGVPLFISGQAGQLWHAGERPSLGIELEGAAGTVFVELSAEGLRRPRPRLELPPDLREAEDFILL